MDDLEWRYGLEKQHTAYPTKLVGGQDIDLLRRSVWEAMITVGIKVDFYKCRRSDEDLYNDPTCVWEDKITVDAIFESVPAVKVLKSLGWFHEDEEIRAPIIYLPIYSDWAHKTVLQVTDNSIVKVHYFGEINTADFRITEKKMDSVYGCYWVCKLAPEKLELFEKVLDNGLYYLKKNADRGDSTKCSHDIVTDAETEANGGIPVDHRKYNHSDFSDYTKEEDKYDFTKW